MNEMKRKARKVFRRYINGTKGVISLFMAILMVPFTLIVGSLINAARINSAVAIFDEALCNASNSTLGTYDSFLRSRFGLLAISQDTSGHGSGYTAQDFVNDTFSYYMQENMKTLSNTYTGSTLDAAGIYPIADTDILLTQLLEAGKYTVPIQLIYEGLSIDDLLNSLTKKVNMVSSVFNMTSGILDAADSLDQVDGKMDTARTSLATMSSLISPYETAHTNFVNAVVAYNNMIDEAKEEIAKKQAELDTASSAKSAAQTAYDTEKNKIPTLVSQYESVKNNYDDLVAFLAEHEDEMEDFFDAESDLDDATRTYNSADTALQNTINTYNNKLSGLRATVTETKSTYATATDSLASATLTAGNAVIAAQQAIVDAQTKTVSAAVGVVDTIVDAADSTNKKEIKDLEKQQKDFKESGNTDAANEIQAQIDQKNADTRTRDNRKTVLDNGVTAVTGAVTDVNTFSTTDYQTSFSAIYTGLIQVRDDTNNYTVYEDNSTKLASTDGMFYAVTMPIDDATIQTLLENLTDDVVGSSFFAFVTAAVDFIRAMLTIDIWFDMDLCSNIDTSLYEPIGGLPSTKDRSEGSPYAFVNAFDDQDSKKSNYYKTVMGEYATTGGASAGELGILGIIENILSDIEDLKDATTGWTFLNIFSKIAKLVTATVDIMIQIGKVVANIGELTSSFISQRFLLTGYISYNTANRTTYTKSALTGASYSLPTSSSGHQGYCFYGAETEYILNGSMSELSNQTMVFHEVYAIRFIYDIFVVFLDSEVESIASEAGACTYGIGTVVVYILYLALEPFVDTIILVNAGSVPLIKMNAYLTPTGIVDMLSEFVSIKLSDAQKNDAYKSVVKVMSAGMTSDSYAENYADAVSSGMADPEKKAQFEKTQKMTQFLKIDYTQHLYILMMITGSNTKMLNRLADIIQMESSYKAVNRIDPYTFNLDNSFTYLRASGSFDTNEFISISGSGTPLSAQERVVYRGY